MCQQHFPRKKLAENMGRLPYREKKRQTGEDVESNQRMSRAAEPRFLILGLNTQPQVPIQSKVDVLAGSEKRCYNGETVT
jgi:hypothetical protein